MRIVKLNAIDSTNNYLKALGGTEFIDDYTVVTAKNQTEGKGQRGSVWSSEASKNLMFSVFKDLSDMPLEHPFYVSMITSLALLKTLKSFEIPKLSVKWPNDILSADKKICGVLIENVIKKNKINASIIGIGLNVNQTTFENLPKASSLKRITDKTFDVDEILKVMISNLKSYFLILKDEKYESIKEEYEAQLFRKNKPSTFKNAEGLMFSGFIKSVSDAGYLQVLLEDDVLKAFDLKEITLLY
ncbi:biotin--[acetyl-CoA-carboxylase] ligase [Algibacter amylolyticus]|uniref:Biotin--[acetyl-CoA-carboxylase] ligase n=1 Tax=Algibacter amylolyticus TaxID=1608400 RepID=A0A5M7B9Z4_9FLAO|nr:biotin--[acetyl-CoA-carboxylase] ligase [Algibacter amylolyticus]KAA5824115.1 biotin--[acetyl-CoA-carboxylase] ligase [Algibacter amylolyticus]MBB5269672.1 BirA family biotin operon repressor/biotin-[acetyl-CoA-carboxylase] ligase [Algibacter amylolyticus]TSJ74592.1 biotin--[acetyl-CoA-carboxylase] ligase [Algibacter amylolyticus]